MSRKNLIIVLVLSLGAVSCEWNPDLSSCHRLCNRISDVMHQCSTIDFNVAECTQNYRMYSTYTKCEAEDIRLEMIIKHAGKNVCHLLSFTDLWPEF